MSSVSFSPDGTRIVSGSGDKTVRVWDALSGQCVLGPLEGHTDWVRSVSFSPDGTRIVSGSYDKTVRVWDASSGECVLGPLEGHASYVWSVSFSPDGSRIVSGSRDKTVRVWDVPELALHDFTRDTVALALISKADRLSNSAAMRMALWVMFGEPLTRLKEQVRNMGGTIVDPTTLELVLARTTAHVAFNSFRRNF